MKNKSYFKIVNLSNDDERGSIFSIDFSNAALFPIRRCYWFENRTPDTLRGFHAHKKLKQVITCLKGSVTIDVDDGIEQGSFELSSPRESLVLVKPVWRVLKNFTQDASVMVYASDPYDENDYIRNYEDFKDYVSKIS